VRIAQNRQTAAAQNPETVFEHDGTSGAEGEVAARFHADRAGSDFLTGALKLGRVDVQAAQVEDVRLGAVRVGRGDGDSFYPPATNR